MQPVTRSVVMAMAGVRMPLESYPLQALVSEPVKPIMPCVVMSNTIHAYMSQSDKGELVIGAGTDAYTSYSQTGGLHIASAYAGRDLRTVPDGPPPAHAAELGRHRRRDARPLADIGKTPVPGLFVNCGWGTGGFKATPGSGHVFAHTVATRRAAPHQRALHARSLPRPAASSTRPRPRPSRTDI